MMTETVPALNKIPPRRCFHLILPAMKNLQTSPAGLASCMFKTEEPTLLAMAAFTLTSTLKSNDLGAKIQATDPTSGLDSKCL
jgi:hypothetical protein